MFGRRQPPPVDVDDAPHPLSRTDVQSFLDAAGKRSERVIASNQRQHRQDFLAMLAERHPIRMRRMHSDLNWLLKQGRKYGLSPDELRLLLW